jgi:hypothetical protein
MASILNLQRLEVTSPDEAEPAISWSITSCDSQSCQ